MNPAADAAPAQHSHLLVGAVFQRLLGIIYLVAFISIGVQIEGLVGRQGILPVPQYLDRLFAEHGISAVFTTPTVFWLNASDTALWLTALAGGIAAVFIIFGKYARRALIAAFIFYLSLYHAGQAFMNFQWDTLLLEAGFLAIFLSPGSTLVVFLFRLLLFKLRFMSGLSKLVSGDPAWRELTALNHYFEVQPLPTPLAWYAHHLPEWLLKTGTAGTLLVELVIPFMMFLPRPWRFTAAWLTILWQVLIILTSNHNWFNFLTIALCLFLFDDRAVARVAPSRLGNWLIKVYQGSPRPGRIHEALLAGATVIIVFVSGIHLWELTTLRSVSGPINRLVETAEAWRIVSKYHVFPTMKTRRIELQIQGSRDGVRWHTYRFRYKPDRPERRPGYVIPHQPRLDWMMWFPTLHPLHLQWFEPFLRALLENRASATALLAHNPFEQQPPRFIRVRAYHYRFTTPAEGERSGHWWQRRALGPFTPLPGLRRHGGGSG